jgi:DNA-binding response OmpR family regulator
MKVLIVEDEQEIRRLIELHLRDQGHEVVAVADGTQGLELAVARPWDLLVLDLTLPGTDGLDICREVRIADRGLRYTPVLMLTARSSELDRVLGLETGADDYLTKPFSVRELLARIKAIFRRAEAMGRDKAPSERLAFGELEIDCGRRRVTLADGEVRLTAKEFDLLVHFAKNPGHVFSRAELLDRVWGYGHDGYEHTVNSHINRLRAKIERDPAKPRFVVTVWGVGYRFAEPNELQLDKSAVG